MLDIVEDRLLAYLVSVLTEDLGELFLDIEEEQDESLRLLPFRYVGEAQHLIAGTPQPYALLSIEEGTYSEKDRIIRNIVFAVKVTIHVKDARQKRIYLTAIRELLTQNTNAFWRVTEIRVQENCTMALTIKEMH